MLHAAVNPSFPASGVTHSLVGQFSTGLPEGVRELILFKKNNLELWQIPCGREGKSPLSYVTSTQLYAAPVSVAACRPSGFNVDVVVMCLDDFHVSFVQYDPVFMRLRTLALVQLDDREVVNDVCPLHPIMRADPSGRFVAVLARRRHMFLIPLLGLNRANNGDNVNGICAEDDTNNNMKETTTAIDEWGDEDDYKGLATEEDHSIPPEATKAACILPEEHNSKFVNTSDGLLSVGSPSMFSIALTANGSIRYVRDMQFIESSGEPILAFLCERHPTWAGRVKLVEWRTKAVESKMLSSQVVWVQISATSTSNQKLLLIGEVDDIPYNVTHMTPVGPFAQISSGVVCYGINTVMHVTTKRGYGVYLNNGGMEECANGKSSAMSFGKVSWCDPHMETSTALFKVNLSLANCTAASVGTTNGMLQLLVVSEEDGVVLTLCVASQGSSVQGIHIGVLGTGCYCSSISPIGNQIFFLGSVCGDSCLAKIDAFHGEVAERFRIIDRMEAVGCIADIDVVDCTSVAENGLSQLGGVNGPSLDDVPYAELLRRTTLEPMPSVSIAECREVMDLAVCAGRGGSGFLYVMRQSVRNNVFRRENVNAVSAFFLEYSHVSKRSRVERERVEGTTHLPLHLSSPHLLLTGLSFTILFTVRGESIQHVRRSEFLTGYRTVFATEIPWLNALLQVTEREGRIISCDGRNLLQKFTVVPEREVGKKRLVKSASLMADWMSLFVLVEDGTLLRFSLKEAQATPTKEVFAEGVTAFALWQEQRRVVTFSTNGAMFISEVESSETHAAFPQFATLPPYSFLGEDASTKSMVGDETFSCVAHAEVVALRDGDTVEATSLVVILANGELAVYKVMSADTFGPLRLTKSMHHFLDNKAEREVIESIEMKKQRLQRERAMIENDTQLMRQYSRRIVSFDAIGGNSGVYVCGQHPLFLFWDLRTRELVAYRHQTLGPVRGFVPFPLIPSGYVYCCEGFVDFASMNTYCRPGGQGWLTRRIHLGVTPHFVVYHPPAQSCFVVTSMKEPFRPQRAPFDVHLNIVYDEEGGGVQSITTEVPACNMQAVAPDAGVRVPMVDRFEIRLMSTTDWSCTDTLVLEENEQVLGAEMMEIHAEKDVDGVHTAPVCVVSTAFPLGEDVTCRGRILILSTMRMDKKWKILLFHSEPLNGPATAVVGICKHIAVAVGGTIKLFRFDWKTRKLVVGALLYAEMYVTRMSSFRNYLIYGDLSRSCAIARFTEANHTLNVLGKDRNVVSVVHCDMMYHDRAFGILCSDDERNLLIMGYTPRVQETEAGRPNKVLESVLSLDGEYRLPGGCLVKSLRFRSLAGNSSVTLYATNYGEVGFIVPIGEQANRTASWLMRRLQMDLPHSAGLTPRMFLGLSQGSLRTAMRAKEMLVSAALLNEFFLLDIPTRKTIASAAYTQLERVINVATLIYEECNLF
ncbi:cleavage and polyadenylation specificity factor-like protein [Trypanosoma rangeli]|uniref:Cleavage and polyadenylation specificity factor-like protein n=1 Tax=Trypanosoma rangeli TaxID=5698 RepID=A0A422P1D6_TRYRA|nr:cleavage and polyadenylation specificity factor-like protein [Trypanosoma rangeli]RNF11511.1 cleavage and polyadenylation specificity factor-like protein [Trypanosoma rangeli]|eukprot:RNF11511.1 cleavage and polyadenylation specificity factor-like protein [Trypanosoma rangeli]